MSIAHNAIVQYSIAKSKRAIEDAVMTAARSEKRMVEMPSLPCQREHIDALTAWMQSEGLKLEHVRWRGLSPGFGHFPEDDGLVDLEKYVITF